MPEIDPRSTYRQTSVSQNWGIPVTAAFFIFLASVICKKDYPKPQEYTTKPVQNQHVEKPAPPNEDPQSTIKSMSIPNVLHRTAENNPNPTRKISQGTLPPKS
jgi:hypothetical protein